MFEGPFKLFPVPAAFNAFANTSQTLGSCFVAFCLDSEYAFSEQAKKNKQIDLHVLPCK
jgi:hypothetical protein